MSAVSVKSLWVIDSDRLMVKRMRIFGQDRQPFGDLSWPKTTSVREV